MSDKSNDTNSVKPPCVVVDTNVWRSDHLLKTAMGASLIFWASQADGYIGLPEVVEMEIGKQISKAGKAASEEVAKNLRLIGTLIGSCPACPLPDADDFQKAVAARLAELKPLLKRVSLTVEHARGALKRVNEETPPNGPKNQQFKDSLIWEAVLDVVVSHQVHLITKDKGFFKNGDYEAGLASNLQSEIGDLGAQVSVHSDIASCLEALRTSTPPLDNEKLARTVAAAILSQTESVFGNRGFVVGPFIGASIKAFVTEKADALSVAFSIEHKLTDVSGGEGGTRENASIVVKGECNYEVSSGAVSNVVLDSESFKWADQGGQPTQARNLYLHAGQAIVSMNPQQTSYRLREPIE